MSVKPSTRRDELRTQCASTGHRRGSVEVARHRECGANLVGDGDRNHPLLKRHAGASRRTQLAAVRFAPRAVRASYLKRRLFASTGTNGGAGYPFPRGSRVAIRVLWVLDDQFGIDDRASTPPSGQHLNPWARGDLNSVRRCADRW